MTSFVRKSLVTIRATFTLPGQPCHDPGEQQGYYSTVPPPSQPPLPPPVQPTAASATLEFRNLGGSRVTETIPMILGSDGVTWSCVWDSSAAGPGEVLWVVFASGAVQAANQGSFTVLANRANNF